MPKATTPSRTTGRRHNPLVDDILSASNLRTKSSKRKSKLADGDEEEGPGYIDSKTSRKILQIGRDLIEEDAAEGKRALSVDAEKLSTAFDFTSRFDGEDIISDDEDKFEEDQWGDEDIEDVVCSSTRSLRERTIIGMDLLIGRRKSIPMT